MKKTALLLFVICGLLVLQSCSNSKPNSGAKDASFIGKVQFSAYNVKNGKEQKMSDYKMVAYVTPQRIRFKLPSGARASGFLIRNDKGDILYFRGNDKAIRISKDSIDFYNSLIADITGTQSKNKKGRGTENSFKKTGKKKKIDGYKCEQFEFTSKKVSKGSVILWMTKALNINWGFITNDADVANLALRPLGILSGFGSSMANTIINKGYFPVVMKVNMDGSPVKVLKAKITATDEAKSHVSVSPDVKITGVQKLLKQALQQKQ